MRFSHRGGRGRQREAEAWGSSEAEREEEARTPGWRTGVPRQKSQELLPDPEEEEASLRENKEMGQEAGGIETQTP